MKNFVLICFLAVLAVTSFLQTARAEAPKFPRISVITGDVEFESRDVKVKPTKGLVLREKSRFRLKEKAELEIELDEVRRMILLPNSELLIPSISWETGEAPLVVLNKGLVRWIQNEKAAYNIALSSALFGFLAPPGDYVIGFDPVEATSDLYVIKGHVEFSAMNADESAMVESGNKVHFQGVLEGNEIAYDVLLKGKKVPRGKLGKVTELAQSDRDQFSEQKLQQRRLEIKKIEAKERAKKLPKPGEICKEPFAKLNDCVWTCEQTSAEGDVSKESNASSKVSKAPKAPKANSGPKAATKALKTCPIEDEQFKCVRRSCNANGDWVDRTELSGIAAKKCTAKPIVGACDY